MEAAPGRPESDAQLVARFRGGDESAYDELVLRHRAAVYRLAFRLVGRHAEADDVAQEALFRAYRGLGRFRGEAAFGTWLTRIAVNLALSGRRNRGLLVPIDQAVGVRATAGSGPESMLRREVRDAVQRLPRRQKQVLALKVYEGMKFVEIARAVGISVGTAKATFFQAVRKLRDRLAPRDGTPGEGR